MLKKASFLALLIASAAASTSAAAQILPSPSNALLFNATLGTDLNDYVMNTALDDANGNTNPLFNLTPGQSLLFGVAATGTFPDFLTATFGGGFFSIADPNVNGTVVYPISTQGGNSYRELLTFNTVGSFTGSINLNLLVANPDYSYDGGASPGSTRREAPTFSFRVNVTDASGAVPEPAAWAMMLMGFGGIGFALRRRRTVAMRTAPAN